MVNDASVHPTPYTLLKSKLQIWKQSILFSIVFKSVGKHHLINFTQSREQYYTPVVVVVVSFSSFPFK